MSVEIADFLPHWIAFADCNLPQFFWICDGGFFYKEHLPVQQYSDPLHESEHRVSFFF